MSYVGASRADLIDGVEPDDESANDDEEEPDNVEMCDLCEEEYVPEE